MSVRKGTTLRKARPAEATPPAGTTVAHVTPTRRAPRTSPRPRLPQPPVKSQVRQAADAVAELAAMRAEWPNGVAPWRVTPPEVPGLPKGKTPEVLTELPAIGTLVVIKRSNGPQIGTVTIYEHYLPDQDSFPVRWGSQSTMESVGTVWALPKESQPLGRTAPRRVGKCARLDLEVAQRRGQVAALPPQRRGGLVVEGTVLRNASA